MPLVLDNPILQSYVQGLQMRKQREQQQFENTLQTAQNDRAKQQLDAYLKNLDLEQKHREAELDLHRQQIGMERMSHELQARKTLADMYSTGVMKPPTQEMQTSSPVGGMVDIGGTQYDPRQFSSPQEMLAAKVNSARQLGGVQSEIAGQTASAEARAKQPFELEQIGAKGAQETTQHLLLGKQAMERTMADIEGRKAVARINGQYDIEKAKVMQFAGIGDPDTANQTVLPFVLGDAQKPLGNTPRDLMLRRLINKSGFKEVTAKETTELQKIRLIDPVFTLMKEFINQVPKSNIGAGGQLVLSKIPTTTLNDFKARVRSMGGALASNLDAQTGRMANQEIERVLGGLATPGKTLDSAIKDVDLLRARYSSKALDVILGGIPEKQKLLILKDRKFDPATFVVDYNGREIPRYKQDPSDGEWLVFDPSKKGYVSVDATGQQ